MSRCATRGASALALIAMVLVAACGRPEVPPNLANAPRLESAGRKLAAKCGGSMTATLPKSVGYLRASYVDAVATCVEKQPCEQRSSTWFTQCLLNSADASSEARAPCMGIVARDHFCGNSVDDTAVVSCQRTLGILKEEFIVEVQRCNELPCYSRSDCFQEIMSAAYGQGTRT